MPPKDVHLKISNGLLYTTSDYITKVRAYNASTGVKLWEFELGDYRSKASDPLLSNGTLYVVIAGKLFSLDATTGTKKWEYTASKGLFDAPPTLADGVLYATTDSKTLHSIEAATGRELLESPIGLDEPIYASPLVDSGLIFLSGYMQICALEVGSGKVKWKVDNGNRTYYYHPMLAGGLIYSASMSHWFSIVKFYALDAATGSTKWEFPTPYVISYNLVAVKD
ncbi:PQQ-binding-like beta-propeller repeat protein [Larkinella insperata]|uniref:PQQ-binding-like beta-propeller repeat protein n=1 Tax=Larkinella insperata TaxID=332158 RepID=A0ABW3QIV9_9BACT|nr:PQQ-binding-like beta-propeller repeat protein [Larkinella insperata]